MNPAVPSDAHARLDAIVKAYDVRGIVGERAHRAVRRGPRRRVRRRGRRCGREGRRRARHARLLARASPPRSRAVPRARRRRRVDRPLLDRRELLRLRVRWTPRRRCSPRATTRPPTTASSSRARAPRASRLDTGLAAIRDRAGDYLEQGIPDAATAGRRHVGRRARRLRRPTCARSSTSAGVRPLKIVVDAGNGMGGLTVPAVLGEAAGLPALPLEVVPLYFELDGTFPNHEANPLEPANLVDLQRAVRRARRRPRPRLRRRRRPLLRRRRAGRRRQPVGGRRDRRAARDRPRAGRRRGRRHASSTT